MSDTAHTRGLGSENRIIDNPTTIQHNPDDKETAQWNKPTCIALIVFGMIGLGAGTYGLTSFGAHHNWWAAKGLVHLTETDSIIMMVVGGTAGSALIIIGVVCFVKKSPKGPDTQVAPTANSTLPPYVPVSDWHERLLSDEELLNKLGNLTYTYVLRKDGQYDCMCRDEDSDGNARVWKEGNAIHPGNIFGFMDYKIIQGKKYLWNQTSDLPELETDM